MSSSNSEPTINLSTMVGVAAPGDPTMCNRYQDIKLIFTCRGRPFGCLVSPHLLTPTSTIIDFNLVKELGLKMFDLQYQMFSYCGNKLRILRRVSFSVQTIHDGLASGSFHIKANVHFLMLTQVAKWSQVRAM